MIGLLLLCAGILAAEDRPTAADWPVHVELEKAEFGAEYMVHSVTRDEDFFVVRNYLVVDIGIYPRKPERLEVSHQHFLLRVNGKKNPIFPQSPGMVAAGMKYDDWEYRPNLEASAGTGDKGVILGRERTTERFPGDPRPRQQRLPRPPRAPDSTDQSGIDRKPKKTPDEVVVAAALEEGFTPKPIRGYLYYAYKGKPGSIKSVELIYKGPAGETVLKLK
jgi:hypothetical protein